MHTMGVILQCNSVQISPEPCESEVGFRLLIPNDSIWAQLLDLVWTEPKLSKNLFGVLSYKGIPFDRRDARGSGQQRCRAGACTLLLVSDEWGALPVVTVVDGLLNRQHRGHTGVCPIKDLAPLGPGLLRKHICKFLLHFRPISYAHLRGEFFRLESKSWREMQRLRLLGSGRSNNQRRLHHDNLNQSFSKEWQGKT